MVRHPASLLLLGVFIISLLFLGQSFLAARARGSRLELLRNEVALLQDKVSEKEEELSYRSSLEFAEKEARDQLGYAKRGETVVVLSDFEEKVKGAKEEVDPDLEEGGASGLALPYWKQWRILFFGN